MAAVNWRRVVDPARAAALAAAVFQSPATPGGQGHRERQEG
ncbi:MAG: hypothetical protein M0Z42_06170 [Actinomycetota bacterium]|nr:hypothetical protein [Actinomycetota bacterium]